MANILFELVKNHDAIIIPMPLSQGECMMHIYLEFLCSTRNLKILGWLKGIDPLNLPAPRLTYHNLLALVMTTSDSQDF